MNQPTHQHTTIVMGTNQKSMGVAIVLTILFGPLGLFYASVVGGAIMIVLSLVLGLITFGFAIFLIWPACVIWAAIAVNKENAKFAAQASAQMQPNSEGDT